MHVTAIGADAPGMQEFAPEALLQADKLIVDDLRQCAAIGELQRAVALGLVRPEQIYGTLDAIVAGKLVGRETAHEITFFDSTGVAAQDLATAHLILARSEAVGAGALVKW